MKIRDFMIAVQNISEIKEEIHVGNEILTIEYSVIFNILNIKIGYMKKFYVFGMKCNYSEELVIDLTEDKFLINNIPRDIYQKVIKQIFNQEI